MSEQILKAVQEIIPSLDNTKWEMYDVKGTQLVDTGAKWHFTKPNDVHDDPECWHGHWEKVNDDKIEIKRRNDQPPCAEYKYSVVFAGPDIFVANGDDEAKNRTLIAIRQK